MKVKQEPWNDPKFIRYLRYSSIVKREEVSAVRRKVKPLRQCLLPNCTKQTSHNGGYCCAEHCLEHRSILKGAK